LFDLEENSDQPLTYVLDHPVNIDKSILHTDGTLGVRIPRQEFCRELVRRFGKAIVSTSANLSGQPSPVHFNQVSKEIVEAVDHCVDPAMEKGATGRASAIIKIKTNGEFSFIRK
jgi:L-threonylcarbamoyladenylate synthase